MFHHESDRVGDCRLLTYEATACDPACTGGEVCIDAECFSYPPTVSAGTLTLTGVADAPVEIEPATEPPQPVGDWSAAMAARAAGKDVTLTWSNPYDTARVYLRMPTCVGTHGGISPVEIECEGRNSRSLTLPGAFLDSLYNPAYWTMGLCGDNQLLRYHATEVEVGTTTVQLRTQSPAGFGFRP